MWDIVQASCSLCHLRQDLGSTAPCSWRSADRTFWGARIADPSSSGGRIEKFHVEVMILAQFMLRQKKDSKDTKNPRS